MFGIDGAAVAKCIVMAADAFILTFFALRLSGKSFTDTLTRGNAVIGILILVAFGTAFIPELALSFRIILYLAFITAFLILYVKLWGTGEIRKVAGAVRNLRYGG